MCVWRYIKVKFRIFDVQQRRDGLCGVQDVDVIIQIVLEIVWCAVCH